MLHKFIFVVVVLTVLAILVTNTAPAWAVECQASKGDGYWAWRQIDGRKCWFKGQRGMSKSNLHWGKPPKIVPMLGDERALIIPPPPARTPAARPETPAGSRPPATTVTPAASPAREAPRGQVVRVDPKGAARPEPGRAERGKVDAA